MSMDKRKKRSEHQSLKTWLADITLTSGDSLNFYVSAINQFEANKKADSYCEMAENGNLKKFYGGFKYLP